MFQKMGYAIILGSLESGSGKNKTADGNCFDIRISNGADLKTACQSVGIDLEFTFQKRLLKNWINKM